MISPAPTPPSILYVIPTLGRRQDYLLAALNSILAQDYPHRDVVLVAPESAVPVRLLAESREVAFAAQRGRGISNAINQGWTDFGLGHQYWAWLGDDDSLLPGSSRTAVRVLDAEPRATMVYGRCMYVDGAGHPLYEARPGTMAARLLRWGPDLVPQPGSVARAAAVQAVGFLDESLGYAMDLDLFLRLKDQGPLIYTPQVLATFRWHADSATVAGQGDSAREARGVRSRTWVGRRAVGRAAEPAAVMAGRVLYRLHRRRPSSRPGGNILGASDA